MDKIQEAAENAIHVVWITVSRLYHHSIHSFDGMNMTRWLRLIAIVGAYMLLRPYILKFMSTEQAEQFRKQGEAEKAAQAAELAAKRAKISPNAIRGHVEEISDSDEEVVEASGNEPQWGSTTRKRNQKAVKEILEAKEKLLEEEDLEDVREFLKGDDLIDFEAGKDGW